MLRHWLLGLNVAIAVFVAGALVAPVAAALGWSSLAAPLYAVYHLACHQWAFRSFFLFGPQAAYTQPQLEALGVDPYAFIGTSASGWKMAFCERDLAIYVSLLLAGIVYARRRSLPPLGFVAYGVLILPMALDGFTQLFGWRESTWELRVLTGLVFGFASAWLVYPRFDASLGLQPTVASYAAEDTCVPLPPLSPRG